MWFNKWRCAALCRKFLRFEIGGTQLFGDIVCSLLLLFFDSILVRICQTLVVLSESVTLKSQRLIVIVGKLEQLLTDFIAPIGPLLSQVVAE